MTDNEFFNYDDIPVGYYDMVHSRTHGVQAFWHKVKFEQVYDCFPDIDRTTILDVACGPGTFLGNYIRNAHGLGIDLAHGQIEYARAKYGSERIFFETASSSKIRDKGQIFNVVTCIEFIEHVTEFEVERMLQDIRLCLPGSGTLVITTPNYRGLWPLLEWSINKIARGQVYDQQHITHWNRKKIRNILISNGYKVEQLRGIHGLAPFIAPLSWKFARWFSRIEKPFVLYSGFLLLVVATKNEDST